MKQYADWSRIRPSLTAWLSRGHSTPLHYCFSDNGAAVIGFTFILSVICRGNKPVVSLWFEIVQIKNGMLTVQFVYCLLWYIGYFGSLLVCFVCINLPFGKFLNSKRFWRQGFEQLASFTRIIIKSQQINLY